MELNILLVACFSLAALIEIAAPILLGFFLARRFGCRWRHWLYGLLVFLVFQGILRIPAMVLLQSHPAVK